MDGWMPSVPGLGWVHNSTDVLTCLLNVAAWVC